MAQITISINDNDVSRVLDAFETKFGYQSQVPDGDGNPIPNPESRVQFAKRMLAVEIKRIVKREEARAAADIAAAATEPDVS